MTYVLAVCETAVIDQKLGSFINRPKRFEQNRARVKKKYTFNRATRNESAHTANCVQFNWCLAKMCTTVREVGN